MCESSETAAESDCSNNGASDVSQAARTGAAVSHKVELSRQWGEVKRGEPRKRRGWNREGGRVRSESGERIKLNFAHFLKGRQEGGSLAVGGAGDGMSAS